MKRQYMVEFELPEVITQEFMELIPAQREVVERLMLEGKMHSYALASDQTMAWAIIEADSEFTAMEILTELPLCEFLIPFVSELDFHQSAHFSHQFSLN